MQFHLIVVGSCFFPFEKVCAFKKFIGLASAEYQKEGFD